MNLERVIKRDGSLVPYDRSKIVRAISGANNASVEQMTERELENIVNQIETDIGENVEMAVEDIQDVVERRLMQHGRFEIAKKYICYRYKHMLRRESKKNLMQTYKDILFKDSKSIDDKRENANINTDNPMGIMLKLGTEGSKQFLSEMMPERFTKMNEENWAHIHDADFSLITFNCLQMDLLKLFHGGFSTGHGYLREPGSIRSYAALECVAIQSSQNSMFGGQSANCHDYAMAEGIRKSFIRALVNQSVIWARYNRSSPAWDKDYFKLQYSVVTDKVHYLEKEKRSGELYDESIITILDVLNTNRDDYACNVYELACEEVEEETHQAMEACIFNFNTLHSRAGWSKTA